MSDTRYETFGSRMRLKETRNKKQDVRHQMSDNNSKQSTSN